MKKRLLAAITTITIILSIFSLMLTANAYTTPPTVTETQALAKINKLIDLLDGKYFTVNQKTCTSSRVDPHGCDNCSNSLIIQQKWFTDIFGTGLSVYQFPTHADYNWGVWNKGVHGGGKSCYGFTTFAQWYIFSNKITDDVEHEIIAQNITCNYDNMKKHARPGDAIRTSSGHSMIFISCDKNDYRVLDCNGWLSDPNCIVRSKTRSYKGTMAITRAQNYEPDSTSTVTTKTQYRYYHYTDGKGHYSVCAYYGKNKYGGTWYREDTGWLDTPLTKVANNYIHTSASTCKSAGCTDPSWEGGKYENSGGIPWYHEETRTVTAEAQHTHTYDSGTITKKATCTATGTKTYTCTVCAATKTETVNKLGHSYDSGRITQEATCGSNGIKTYTCTTCGGTKTEKISADSAHSFGDRIVTKEPTCTENGTETYTCTVCGKTQTQSINKSGHNYTVVQAEIESTCTEKGKTAVEECLDCGATRGGKAISIAKHVYSDEWQIDKEPTCTEKGSKSRHCINCGEMGSSTSIPKEEHTYGEWEITTPSKPGKKGSKERTCLICDHTETKSLTAISKKSNDKRIIMTIGCTDATVFGKDAETDVPPIIVKSRTMLPARFVAENLGAAVEWDASTRKVTIIGTDVKIELYIDKTSAYVNGKAITLDCAPFIKGNRTYLPVRFIAESLGASVEWNGENQQAIITKK
ncbi:MAG: hypothetical protein IJA60_03675 [Clostridia bacterium]|nr:hypothetical protein [Clostridia bacterium]